MGDGHLILGIADLGEAGDRPDGPAAADEGAYPGADIATVKDRYAAVIEQALRTANTTDYNQMSIEIVRALEVEGIMPTTTQYPIIPAFDPDGEDAAGAVYPVFDFLGALPMRHEV